jgi:hypothetical protein
MVCELISDVFILWKCINLTLKFLLKLAYTKLNVTHMEDYNIFLFFMNDKLIIAVLCFGSHICNQAARIRVNTYNAHRLNFCENCEIKQILRS